jgi:acyl-CoA thioester hydrolase
MTIPAPFVSAEQTVQDGWIDYNGHMNVGYYGVALDLGFDPFLDAIGFNEAYRSSNEVSSFTVESHMTYQAELMKGEPFTVETQILAYDEKRLHIFQRLVRSSDKATSATCEWMVLHMDMKERKVAPWTSAILENIAAWHETHKSLGVPSEVGRLIKVKNPLG